MERRLSLALVPTSLFLAVAPLAAAPSVAPLGGGENALNAKQAEELTALFEKMLTSEPSCTEACGEAAKEKKEAAYAAGKGEQFAKYAEKKKGECIGCGEVNPAAVLSATCFENEGTWDVLQPLVGKKFVASTTTEDQRVRMLNLLAWNNSEASLSCANDLLEAKPAAFSEKHILAFAQRGSEPCMDAVAKLAKKGQVVPAAFLALRGDEVGKKTLAKAARPANLAGEQVSEALLAAIALRELGDEKSLAKLQKVVHASVLKKLDAGEIDAAREIALRAQHASAVLEAGKNALLSGYSKAANDWCAQNLENVAAADDVFHLIEKLTPM